MLHFEGCGAAHMPPEKVRKKPYAENVNSSCRRMIDLFSGAGGMTLGFSQVFGHRFAPVWANDINEFASKTYNLNFGDHCTTGDIVDLLRDNEFVVPSAHLVIGGPPCQGFSLLNKNRAGDPRKQLWLPFLEVVQRSGASVFVMENVPQMLGSPEFHQIVDKAKEYGFQVASAKLCAADYGVAQIRQRAFILGCNFADPAEFFPPLKTHRNPNNGFNPKFAILDGYIAQPLNWVGLKEIIGDLPPNPEGTEIREIEPPLDLHFGRNPKPKSLQRYKAVSEEGMNRFDLQRIAPELTPQCWIRKKTGGTDLFGRLWWDRPAFTIRTEFFKPEKGRYLHPQEHRPITHREAARIQSFPDDFRFLGTKIEIAKQIGNAVPPLLAAHVAGCVEQLLENKPASNG